MNLGKNVLAGLETSSISDSTLQIAESPLGPLASHLNQVVNNPVFLALTAGLVSYLAAVVLCWFVTTRSPVRAKSAVVAFGSGATVLKQVARYLVLIMMAPSEEFLRRMFKAKSGSVLLVRHVSDGPKRQRYGPVMDGQWSQPLDLDGVTPINEAKNRADRIGPLVLKWKDKLTSRMVRLITALDRVIAIFFLGGGTATAALFADLLSAFKSVGATVIIPLLVCPIEQAEAKESNLKFLGDNGSESTPLKVPHSIYLEFDKKIRDDEEGCDNTVALLAAALAQERVLRDGAGNIVENISAKSPVSMVAKFEGFSLAGTDIERDLEREINYLKMGGASTAKRLWIRKPLLDDRGSYKGFDMSGREVSLLLVVPTRDRGNFETRTIGVLNEVVKIVEEKGGVRVGTRGAVPIRAGREPVLFILIPLNPLEWSSTELGAYLSLRFEPNKKSGEASSPSTASVTQAMGIEKNQAPMNGGDTLNAR